MFVKYGSEDHIREMVEKGWIFFNPCKYFRELEERMQQKGMGDRNDGGIVAQAEHFVITNEEGKSLLGEKQQFSLIIDYCKNTPIFCMKNSEQPSISVEERLKLKSDFPEHTHAAIIRDEKCFLDSIRYAFKSKAFAHNVFYEDRFSVEFLEYVKSGSSDIRFYEPRKKGTKYYAKAIFEGIEGTNRRGEVIIDHTNAHKLMFRKSLWFQDQSEYRIVLPYESLIEGKLYQVPVFKAELCSIDDLVK